MATSLTIFYGKRKAEEGLRGRSDSGTRFLVASAMWVRIKVTEPGSREVRTLPQTFRFSSTAALLPPGLGGGRGGGGEERENGAGDGDKKEMMKLSSAVLFFSSSNL